MECLGLKTPKKTPKKSVKPKLVPQPGGKGALQVGNLGNKGGPGRPPSSLRKRLRDSADDRIKVLEDVADGGDLDAKPSDRIKAVDILLKYGLGPGGKWAQEDVVELMQELGAAVAEVVDDDVLLADIKEKWLVVLRSRTV